MGLLDLTKWYRHRVELTTENLLAHHQALHHIYVHSDSLYRYGPNGNHFSFNGSIRISVFNGLVLCTYIVLSHCNSANRSHLPWFYHKSVTNSFSYSTSYFQSHTWRGDCLWYQIIQILNRTDTWKPVCKKKVSKNLYTYS
jgi:hypothetical protein